MSKADLKQSCSIMQYNANAINPVMIFNQGCHIPAVKYLLEYAGSYVDILLKRLLVHYPQIQLEACNKGIGGIRLLIWQTGLKGMF